jgi:antitoxin YefM
MGADPLSLGAGRSRQAKPGQEFVTVLQCSRPRRDAISFAQLYHFAYNAHMKTTSYSELRRNLSGMIDKVNADHEPVLITRDRGKPSAVLMSLEDYASFEETRYLLASPKNAARLTEAVAELEAGQGSERPLHEPDAS